ncbi:MAG: transglycosylase SLT domain-containing protein [Azospirillum sp.]|nr:transglycosylase SLT domain-containing protein [Azospirillum sp.]
MDRLIALMAAAAALAPPAAVAAGSIIPPQIAAAERPLADDPALLRWQAFVAEAAARFGIPEAWVYAVMRAESGGQTMEDGRPITSPKGAMGLMQVMPATYQEMRQAHGLGPDPYDPHDNILAGTAYLRAMRDRFGYPGLFAAYNAGPVRYDDYQRAGRPLPAETRAYLTAILREKPVPPPPSQSSGIASGTGLFVPLRGSSGTSSPAAGAPSNGLFVPLTTVLEARR